MIEVEKDCQTEKEYKYTIRIHGKNGGMYSVSVDVFSSKIVKDAIAHFRQSRDERERKKKK